MRSDYSAVTDKVARDSK